MSTTKTWTDQDNHNMPLLTPAGPNGSASKPASQKKLRSLKQLAVKLLREVQTLSEVHTLDIQQGLDFYEEVSQFEIDLIKRALVCTGGHQGRAAKLLNLKMTTLNSKIKHYNIEVDAVVNCILLDSLEDKVEELPTHA
jgi:transcriptional regulator with GAF, ATPase, and Fis domain